MVKFIDVLGKNLKTIFRDKKGLLFMFLIPIFYYLIMGVMFGAAGNTSAELVYNIGWVDMDQSESNDPYKNLDYIYNVTDNIESIHLEKYVNNESAKIDLENKDLDAYIIFPQGFELYINGSNTQLSQNVTIYYRDSTSVITRMIISSTLMGIIDNIINSDPSAIILSYNEKTITGREANNITQGTPGYLMYGILSSLTGGVILLTSERKDGLLKRLESSQMNPRDMLLGHLLSNTVIVIIQFVIGISILSLFGFHPVIHDLASLIFGVAITVILLSLFQNALALITSAILKTPEAAGGGVWLILIPLMTFSGAFFPLEYVAPNLIPYVGWIPTRIVVVLFQDLMINAVSILDSIILLQYLWLFLEALFLFLIGTKLYRNFVQS